jgi:hypothetical protein
LADPAKRCTRSSNDPEVLAFFDDTGSDDPGSADGTFIQGIEADLVFAGVDQRTESSAQLGGFSSGSHVALENAELDTRAVTGQQGGNVVATAVVSDVVGD